MTALTSTEILSIHKIFGDPKSALVKAARKAVEAGEYAIERRVTVSIRGILKIGEDFTQKATVRLSAPRVVSAFVKVMREEGLSTQKIQALLALVLAEALDPKVELSKDETKQAKADYDRVAKAIAKVLPEEPRNGPVRFNGLAETEKTKQTFPRATVS